MDHYTLEIAKIKIEELLSTVETRTRQFPSSWQPQEVARSIWEIRGYSRLFISYCLSMIGQWFDMVAIMVLFGYVWQTSSFLLAFIPIAYALPQVLFSQFSGIFVQKRNKIILMGCADLVTVFFTILLFFANTPWLALILLALRSFVGTVHFPAQQGLVHELIPAHLKLKAVSWNGGVNQAAKIIAPLIGGALLTLLPAKHLLLFNAFAFMISACLLFSLRKIIQTKAKYTQSPRETVDNTFLNQWKNSWKSLYRAPTLMIVLSLNIVGMFIIQLVDAQFPALFQLVAPTKPAYMTLLIASIGCGSVLTIYIISKKERFVRLERWLSLALLSLGLGFTGLGFLEKGFSLSYILLLGFLCGIGTGISIIITNYCIQTIPQEAEVSSIAGIYQSLTSSTIFISPLGGAYLIHLFGIQNIFLVSGLSLIILTFLPFLMNKKTAIYTFVKSNKS
ncbi:MFS transporter [Cytobacillus sp. FSL R5-0569]|uniref:MFS transporter n=1 Tax=Cytobacillus sp. FSL R5-0569 TaxID=2921649 RepID=UPI0030F97CD5